MKTHQILDLTVWIETFKPLGKTPKFQALQNRRATIISKAALSLVGEKSSFPVQKVQVMEFLVKHESSGFVRGDVPAPNRCIWFVSFIHFDI